MFSDFESVLGNSVELSVRTELSFQRPPQIAMLQSELFDLLAIL